MKSGIFRLTCMRFFIILLLALLSYCTEIAAQNTVQNYVTFKTATPDIKESYYEGLKSNKKGDYKESIKIFSKLLRKEPRFIDARIQFAAALEELKSIDDAVVEYKNVLKIDTMYEPRVLKALGRVLKAQKKYEEAAFYYTRFAVLYKGAAASVEDARLEAASCMLLDQSTRHPWDIKLENLGSGVNTSAQEYLPCLFLDGKSLVFTRVVRGQEDFYISKLKDDGNWGTAEPISQLNTSNNEAGETISADGKTIVFVACSYKDSYGTCDLYISYFKKGKWTASENMGAQINSSAWDSEPSLSADGQTLYFASNRTGGYGESDIWVSQKSKDGKWQKPVPLPAPINDAYKSESPFIHPDGKSLYFRSNIKSGMGGYDLYKSNLREDGTWSEPINLGAPINSTQDEGALVVSPDGRYGYYASNVENTVDVQGGITNYGGNDIYRFEMPISLRPLPVSYVKANVVDAETNKPLVAEIELQDLSKNGKNLSFSSDEDGSLLVCIPSGKSYGFNVSKLGYAFYSQNFQLDTTKYTEPFMLEIKLQKLNASDKIDRKPVVLNNIFFDSGASTLHEESNFELEKLFQLLNQSPSLKIQINGHTDNVGSASDNLSLSTNRAKSVYDFLIKKGIAASRLSYKGYGETKPLVQNTDDISRQSNRRTEFEIK